MDTSLSKALIMVAGVLVAMIVAAFMAYSFRKIGEWASAENDAILVEQVDKFNKEFEAYDKDLMYGVDVISCLNKAKSNNDALLGKYAEKVDDSYAVTVTVNLKSSSLGKAELEESLTVYYQNDSSKQSAYTNNDGPKKGSKTLKELDFKFLNTSYSNLSGTIFNDKNMSIKTINGNTIEVVNPLVLDVNANDNSDVIKLLKAADAVSQTVKNSDYKSRNDKEGWTEVEFRSALYDMKTRKFTCESLTYNAATGRIDTISFKEIN